MKNAHSLTISALFLLTPLTSRAQVAAARVFEENAKGDVKEIHLMKVAEQVETAYQEYLGGDYLDAARDLQWALRMGPEHPEEVQRVLGECKKQIGTLKLSISEPGAQLVVDGEPVAFWPGLYGGELFVAPGQHHLKVMKEEFATYEATIDVGAGEERAISVALVHQGYELYRKILGIPTQVNLSVEAKTEAPAEPPSWPTKVMIGGIAGFAVGASLCVTGALMPDDQPTWRGVAIGGGVLGVLSLAVVGIGAVGWATRPQPPQPVIIQPVITNQQTGVSVSGHW